MQQASYTIVISARNEEETIREVIEGARHLTDDLIVVDGQSTDRTASFALAAGARVVQDHGRGKGDAVRTGLAAARHGITVFMDADGSHDPGDVEKLVTPIAAGDADLVIGSRMLGGSDELFGSFSEIVRLIGSLVIAQAVNRRYGVCLTDYQNGFRAIRTEVGKRIGLRSNRMTIEQEMVMLFLSGGHRVAEVPSHEHRRKGGVSKLSVLRTAHLFLWNLVAGVIRPRLATQAGATHDQEKATPKAELETQKPATPVLPEHPAANDGGT